MKNLDQIRKEIGEALYQNWYRQAEHELNRHPSLWAHSESRQAMIYQEVIKRYNNRGNSIDGACPEKAIQTRLVNARPISTQEERLHNLRMGL